MPFNWSTGLHLGVLQGIVQVIFQGGARVVEGGYSMRETRGGGDPELLLYLRIGFSDDWIFYQ